MFLSDPAPTDPPARERGAIHRRLPDLRHARRARLGAEVPQVQRVRFRVPPQFPPLIRGDCRCPARRTAWPSRSNFFRDEMGGVEESRAGGQDGQAPLRLQDGPARRRHESGGLDELSQGRAEAAIAGDFDGIGYVFAREDRITGIDLDRRWTRTASPTRGPSGSCWVWMSFTEVSPSGRGPPYLHAGPAGRIEPAQGQGGSGRTGPGRSRCTTGAATSR